MQQIHDVVQEEAKLLSQIHACVGRLRRVLASDATDISDGLALLRRLRSDGAEDINQLQHAALVLQAAKHLKALHPGDLAWYWHPFQTGTIDEPDLRATRNSEVVISAEVTASEKPEGAIDKRMTETLQKLSVMPGARFYFVRTEKMFRRAETKIQKLNVAIKAVILELTGCSDQVRQK